MEKQDPQAALFDATLQLTKEALGASDLDGCDIARENKREWRMLRDLEDEYQSARWEF